MPKPLDVKTDFLLPLVPFTSRLLGMDEDPVLLQEMADAHARLVVMEKFMPVPDNLSEKKQSDYRYQHLLKMVASPSVTLDKELDDIVPAEINIPREIEEARNQESVVSKNVVAHFLSEKMADLCEQIHSGSQIMAIGDNWPGHEKIMQPPHKDTLSTTESILKTTIEIGKKYRSDSQYPDKGRELYKTKTTLTYTKTVGGLAMVEGAYELIVARKKSASRSIYDSLSESIGALEFQSTYPEAIWRYFNNINGGSSENKPPPNLKL